MWLIFLWRQKFELLEDNRFYILFQEEERDYLLLTVNWVFHSDINSVRYCLFASDGYKYAFCYSVHSATKTSSFAASHFTLRWRVFAISWRCSVINQVGEAFSREEFLTSTFTVIWKGGRPFPSARQALFWRGLQSFPTLYQPPLDFPDPK